MNDEQAMIIEILKEMQAKENGAQIAPYGDTCTCDKTPRCPCCGKKLPVEQLFARWQINLPGSPTYTY